MSADAVAVTRIPPATAKAYLVNVAETIQGILLPQLSDRAHARALDCLYTVLHIAAALDAPVPAAGSPTAESEATAFAGAHAAAEELISSITKTPPLPSRSCDPLQIENYFRSHPRGGAALKVESARLLPGGRSKQTILVSVSGARDLPGRLVIRQDWAQAVTGTSVATEFAVLDRVAQAGVRVPVPLILELSKEALGAPFLVVTRLDGKVEGELYQPTPSAQPVRELAEQVGRIHALEAGQFLQMPGIVERTHTPEQLAADVARIGAVMEKLCQPMPLTIRLALDWLARSAPRVKGPRTLVHGDISFHNLMSDDGHLSAILDWEMAHVGSPGLDLGYMKVAVEKAIPWDEFLTIYRASGGPAIDPFVIDWYSLYTNVWFLHMIVQARYAVVSGAMHDMEYAYVCAHYWPQGMAHLARKLADARKHYGD